MKYIGIFGLRKGKRFMKYIGIFGSTYKVAFDKLKDIIYNLKYGEVKRFYQSAGTVELIDGTIYRAFSADSYNVRGHRFTDVYIQSNLTTDVLENIVLPHLRKHDDGSEPSIKYF